ncbi:hypothetical protein SUGI_1137040 [Cryptomeria japonica]|nr:hypothetical protein SUGI_1137040 [Cryptomeria japonica]
MLVNYLTTGKDETSSHYSIPKTWVSLQGSHTVSPNVTNRSPRRSFRIFWRTQVSACAEIGALQEGYHKLKLFKDPPPDNASFDAGLQNLNRKKLFQVLHKMAFATMLS